MEVEPRHARYPFLDEARETVGRLDVAPDELGRADAPAVERGAKRVEQALRAGTVAAEEPDRWGVRDELLSYPVARVLVSLVGDDDALRKYVRAEAATARERFVADFDRDDLRTAPERLTLDELLAEFDLEAAVRRRDDGRFEVAVGTYLQLGDPEWGDRWRLVRRELADGWVPVEREACHRLLEAAVRERVAAGLPVSVSGDAADALSDALAAEIAAVERLVGGGVPRLDAETVAPDRFPPCVTALVERARSDDALPARSRFALLAFLCDLGLGADEMANLTGLDADDVEFPAAVLGDDGRAQYPMPSCATMDEQGDCVNKDERCERVTHPLAYYADAVEADERSD